MFRDTDLVRGQSLLKLTEALIRDREYGQADRLLERFLATERTDPRAGIVRSLRQACAEAAEHIRVAHELEAAAHRHRFAERELLPAIKDLLETWGRPGMAIRESSRACASASAAAVEVRVLGALEVSVDGRPIRRWGSLKARTLFEYLVFHADRPVRREALMETLWPGYTSGSARNNLNVALYALRRTLRGPLGVPNILYADGCYRLSAGVSWWIDLVEFLKLHERARHHHRSGQHVEAIDAYRDADALYRGAALEDDTTSEWHLGEQRRLEELHLQALDGMAELYLELGDPMRAEDVGMRALAIDPCRESAHRLLMLSYAEQHQHHLVSRQLRICTAALRQELGISPAPETVRTFEALTSPTAEVPGFITPKPSLKRR